MQTNSRWLARLACLIILSAAIEVGATQLTFDIYKDATKLTSAVPITSNIHVPQSYGDNVNDFNPTNGFITAPATNYYSYGSAGGLTPHVTVQYSYINFTNRTDTGVGGAVWGINDSYGDLTYSLTPSYGSPWLQEILFTAPAQYQITISNFDVAAFGGHNVSNLTIKIVRNAHTANASTLWSAGPDGTVIVNGGATHDSYIPNILVADGATISLFYGYSGNMAVDNITFIESVPEPSTLCYAVFTALGVLAWNRRHP